MWAEGSGGEGQALGNVSILSKPFREVCITAPFYR